MRARRRMLRTDATGTDRAAARRATRRETIAKALSIASRSRITRGDGAKRRRASARHGRRAWPSRTARCAMPRHTGPGPGGALCQRLAAKPPNTQAALDAPLAAAAGSGGRRRRGGGRGTQGGSVDATRGGGRGARRRPVRSRAGRRRGASCRARSSRRARRRWRARRASATECEAAAAAEAVGGAAVAAEATARSAAARSAGPTAWEWAENSARREST